MHLTEYPFYIDYTRSPFSSHRAGEFEEFVHIVVVVAHLWHLLLGLLVLLDEGRLRTLRDCVLVLLGEDAHLFPICVDVFVTGWRRAVIPLERDHRALGRPISVHVTARDACGP